MGLVREEIQDDPMGGSRFHKVLVFTQNLQNYPSLLLIIIFLLYSGVVAVFWPLSDVPIIYLVVITINWIILWALPIFGRSYGPDRPSALAVAILLGLFMVLMGVFRFPETLAYALMGVVTAVVFYSTWIEPFMLEITHETYITRHFKADAPPLRLLHIGDLHAELITPRERKLNQYIKELQPDIIVFSGDFVSLSYTYHPRVFETVREIIREWQAPLGVYCVQGTYTVEPLERVREFVHGLDNLQLLEDEWVSVETAGGPLHIAGMRTRHIMKEDRAALQKIVANEPEDGLKLLLTHAPDVAPEADRAGFDLYLCGHTHGGQIRFPFIGALFSGSQLGMQFVMGRRDLKNTTVYTTRGLGLEGLGAPRARFLCPPEIILWEIKGQ